ncbi:hypothetical protein KSP40_PGU021364 [Platanthera guangdongensis]|uniref:Uncharacterized protein n=1 Tax=Platanthera guangdongensis TaxID=2320717 RepID=A0ABR2LY66_9ASPA
MGFCNSHHVSHFAALFIDARAKICIAESPTTLEEKITNSQNKFLGECMVETLLILHIYLVANLRRVDLPSI